MTSTSTVFTPNAPAAVGPYSQGVAVGEFLFVSGQLPLLPEGPGLVPGGTAEQAEQVLTNLAAILAVAGSAMSSVVKATIFLTDLADFDAVNAVYSRHFTGPVLPARSTIQVAGLPKGASVEIEVIALLATAAVGASDADR